MFAYGTPLSGIEHSPILHVTAKSQGFKGPRFAVDKGGMLSPSNLRWPGPMPPDLMEALGKAWRIICAKMVGKHSGASASRRDTRSLSLSRGEMARIG